MRISVRKMEAKDKWYRERAVGKVESKGSGAKDRASIKGKRAGLKSESRLKPRPHDAHC